MNSNNDANKIIQESLNKAADFLPSNEAIDSLGTWQEPLPLPKVELLPVAPFDIKNMLPKLLQGYVTDAAYRAQVPPDLIAIPLIDSFSILLGRGYRIYPKQKDDWGVVPNLWGMIIARSGSLKSFCLQEGTKFLRFLAARSKENLQKATEEYVKVIHKYNAEYSALDDLYKKELKENFKKESEGKAIDKTKENNLYEKLCNLKKNYPEPPAERRFISNDSTIEKLHELLSDSSCNGIANIRDEIISMLLGWEKSGHEQDRGFFLEGWNGDGSYQVDRIGRGSPYVPNICLSVLGGTQPDKIQAYVLKNISPLHNDGLIQRFQLMVYPNEMPDWKYVDQYPNAEKKNKVYAIAETIASSSFLREAKEELDESCNIKIINFRFDKDAQELFIKWYSSLKSRIKSEDNPVLEEHLSKYASLIPSLALIFHVITLADEVAEEAKPVSRSALSMAIRWDSYLESHTRRVYNMGENITPRVAGILYKAILDGKLKDGFTVRDVYRNRWQIIGNNPDIAQDACDELVKISVLKEKHTPSAYQQKAKTEYLINTKIFSKGAKNNSDSADFVKSVDRVSTLSARNTDNFFSENEKDSRMSTLSASTLEDLKKNDCVSESAEEEIYEYTEGGIL